MTLFCTSNPAALQHVVYCARASRVIQVLAYYIRAEHEITYITN